MNAIVRRPGTAAVLTGCAAMVVYVWTSAPGIGFIDSGELSTVACTLGIAHPTGYPLFTLVGWVFSRIPTAADEIVRLNVMAAFLCAAAVSFLVLVFRRVILLISGKPPGGAYVTPSASGGALLLAFSATFWSQALDIEVYPLHLLLVSLMLLSFFRANFPLSGEESGKREWYLFAYLVGLAFTNHMTSVLLAPGLLYLYFSQNGSRRRSWSRLFGLSAPFLAGLSLYLYLPLRASRFPLLSWGNTVSAERFLWHVTGKQYQVWMFSSMDVVGKQLSYFVTGLPGEFAAVGLVFAIAGAIVLWRERRRLATGVAFLFLGCVAYASNYDIHDIDSYFLLAYVSLGMAAAAGLFRSATLAALRYPRAKRVISPLLISLSLIPLAYHFRQVDESADYLVEDYTMNMFSSLRPGALVLSYQWDYWVSASYYFQIVRGVRPDVTVIDKELLRRSWYIRELEHRHPWIIAGSRPEVNAFLAQVDLFEHGLPYDPARIESRYVGMIEAFIRHSISTHPVYVTGEIEQEFTRGLFRIPEGMAFRLSTVQGELPASMPLLNYRAFPRGGRLEDMIRRLYADAFLARGEYCLQEFHDGGEARKCLEAASAYIPDSPRGRRLAALIPR